MGALTPVQGALRAHLTRSGRPPCPGQVSLVHTTRTSLHSVTNHPTHPVIAFLLPSSVTDSRSLVSERLLPCRFGVLQTSGRPRAFTRAPVWASPSMSRLAATLGRNVFALLRTASSPPVALHPASRRRSYLRLSGVGISRERTSTSQIAPAPRRTHSGNLLAGIQTCGARGSLCGWIPAKRLPE
jgi:hypothetical protein